MATLVLALNPSVDAEWRVDRVFWEEKNNLLSERRWAGGKGVNVARWLIQLGSKPILLLPLGGSTGVEVVHHLGEEKLPARIVRIHEPTRVNVIVTTAAGRQLRFNPPGPKLSRAEWKRVWQSAKHNLTRVHLLILSGSLPRGVPTAAYAQLIQLARRAGVRTLLDCDGDAFAAAVKAKPFLVKPNEHELAQWWRKPLRTGRSFLRAALALSEVTRGWVLLSRGARSAMLVNATANERILLRPPDVSVVNTVGAGDAMLAAVAQQIERDAPPRQWLCAGVAAGTAATECQAGCWPTRSRLEALARKVQSVTRR